MSQFYMRFPKSFGFETDKKIIGFGFKGDSYSMDPSYERDQLTRYLLNQSAIDIYGEEEISKNSLIPYIASLLNGRGVDAGKAYSSNLAKEIIELEGFTEINESNRNSFKVRKLDDALHNSLDNFLPEVFSGSEITYSYLIISDTEEESNYLELAIRNHIAKDTGQSKWSENRHTLPVSYLDVRETAFDKVS